MESKDKIVRANGVGLCVETFGDPADPAILLIHGATTSMLGWEDEFCERLAAGPRFVVRYDHRDTGRSVAYEPGAPRYTLRDLVADAVGLLDAFSLQGAHLVGRSLGGATCAMLAALDHPDRVASLTLVASDGTHGAGRRGGTWRVSAGRSPCPSSPLPVGNANHPRRPNSLL